MTDSEIIKEVFKFKDENHPNPPENFVKKNSYTIRSLYYGSSVAFINRFVEAAKKDFPGLKLEDITIVHYGGRHYKGTFGIEFQVPVNTEIPNAYKEITTVENLLG